ncbi:flagellar protein FlbD [bacterium]|nr:flagellar protein FlbD [bacterium]
MLELNQLNGDQIWINPDKIKMMFCSPDTTIVFMDDTRMTIKNSVEDVQRKWSQFRQSLQIYKEKEE